MDSSNLSRKKYKWEHIQPMVENKQYKQLNASFNMMEIQEEQNNYSSLFQMQSLNYDLPMLGLKNSQNLFYPLQRNNEFDLDQCDSQFDQDIDNQNDYRQKISKNNTIQENHVKSQPQIQNQDQMIDQSQSDKQLDVQSFANANNDKKTGDKKQRLDNDVFKICSRIAQNAVRSLPMLNTKKILNKKNGYSIAKRNYIHLLMCQVQAVSQQNLLTQFLQRYIENHNKKVIQISNSSDSFQKKKFKIQTLDKTLQGIQQYLNGDFQKSLKTIYCKNKGQSIKKLAYFQQGKAQINKVRIKLKLAPLN